MFEDDPGFMPDYNAPISLGEQFRALQGLGTQAVNFVSGAVRMVPGFLSDVRESFRPENQPEVGSTTADLPRALERAENIASEQVATVTENILGRVGVPESVSTPIAGLTGALLTPGIGDIKMLSMPLVGMVSTNGSMRLAARRGRRGDFLPQEQYDVVRPERINAVRDKRDELKEVIQNIEENNPGVKKGVLAATNKEYKRAKENVEDLDHIDFIRMIAVARIMMPKSHVRLSAGREKMSDEMQAMTFFAGANSIFYGECLLTTPNPETHRDVQLFKKLGINMEQRISDTDETQEAALMNDLQKQQDSTHFYEA